MNAANATTEERPLPGTRFNINFGWPLSNQTPAHPATADFSASLKKWIADDTILIEDVDAGESGIVDIVLVGPAATIGIQFDTRVLDRPVPYFVDGLYVISPLDVLDSETELLYILMKSTPGLFSARARHSLSREARMDRFNFTKPSVGRLSSYEISTAGRRHAPVVLRVLGPDPQIDRRGMGSHRKSSACAA